MKRRNTGGVMVSFTLGFITGLCATSYETREWMQERAHRVIKPRGKRNIIDIVDIEQIS